jgi:maltokinase
VISAQPRGTIGPLEVARWSDRGAGLLQAAVDESHGALGAQVHAARAALEEMLRSTAGLEDRPSIRVHGAANLGAFARRDDRWVIDPYSPTPIAVSHPRFALGPAAVDVAALVESIDHAGRMADQQTNGLFAQHVEEWIERHQRIALDAYEATLAEQGVAELFDRAQLPAFRAEEACRQVVYALRSSAHWAIVAHDALGALIRSGAPGGAAERERRMHAELVAHVTRRAMAETDGA